MPDRLVDGVAFMGADVMNPACHVSGSAASPNAAQTGEQPRGTQRRLTESTGSGDGTKDA